MICGCPGNNTLVPGFINKLFVLEYFKYPSDNQSLVNGTTITLLFEKNGALSGNSGCNAFSGNYEIEPDNEITISNLSSTEMYCETPEGVMDQEQTYLTILGKTISYQDNETILILHSDNQTSLVFKLPTVTAYYNGVEEILILSRPVTFPLSESDANFISTESECDGQLTLQDGDWTFSSPYEYPYCEIKIQANVFCFHFG